MYLDASYAGARSSPLEMPQCPRCGDDFVRRLHQSGIIEAALSRLGLFPFRCQLCALRFWSRSSGLQPRRSDRRRFARIPVCMPVSFATTDLRGRGSVLDLSMNGCAIESSCGLREKETLSVFLYVYDNHPPIQIKRAVVRSAIAPRFGLEFLEMDQYERNRLQLHMKCLLLGANGKSLTAWLGHGI